jgi:hypothetical protein
MYHATKNMKSFYVSTSLGSYLYWFCIKNLYLNGKTLLNLENVDYALVGSFYVSAIWIGIWVWPTIRELTKYLAPKFGGSNWLITASLLGGPLFDEDKTGTIMTALGNIQH